MPAAAISGPAGQEEPRAVAVGERAHAAREREHGQRRRDRRQPCPQRRVAGDLLEEDEEEEEEDRQAGVDRERLQVARSRSCGARTGRAAASGATRAARRRRTRRTRRRRRASETRIAGLPQPKRGCSIRPKTIPARPSAQRPAPSKSTRRGTVGASGTAARTSTSVTSTSGTLIAKIQRHDVWSTIRPPTSGPTMTAIPPQAVQEPIAAPRSRSGNAAAMIASELGVSSAPAAPCSARAAISVSVRRRRPRRRARGRRRRRRRSRTRAACP